MDRTVEFAFDDTEVEFTDEGTLGPQLCDIALEPVAARLDDDALGLERKPALYVACLFEREVASACP